MWLSAASMAAILQVTPTTLLQFTQGLLGVSCNLLPLSKQVGWGEAGKRGFPHPKTQKPLAALSGATPHEQQRQEWADHGQPLPPPSTVVEAAEKLSCCLLFIKCPCLALKVTRPHPAGREEGGKQPAAPGFTGWGGGEGRGQQGGAAQGGSWGCEGSREQQEVPSRAKGGVLLT